MSPLEKLAGVFERFPGIGPRQANRFVYHILTADSQHVEALIDLVRAVRNGVRECALCFRFFARQKDEPLCPICSDPMRDHTMLMVVERDADIEPIERSQHYKGRYFVFGGTIPLLSEQHTAKTRGGALRAMVEKTLPEGLTEVILAFPVNPDGENTARYVESQLDAYRTSHSLTVSILGRGLSTGSELEYADQETIRNALRNRAPEQR